MRQESERGGFILHACLFVYLSCLKNVVQNLFPLLFVKHKIFLKLFLQRRTKFKGIIFHIHHEIKISHSKGNVSFTKLEGKMAYIKKSKNNKTTTKVFFLLFKLYPGTLYINTCIWLWIWEIDAKFLISSIWGSFFFSGVSLMTIIFNCLILFMLFQVYITCLNTFSVIVYTRNCLIKSILF